MVVGSRGQDFAERHDGVEHVDMANVERGEAEAQHVRSPKVGDDAARESPEQPTQGLSAP